MNTALVFVCTPNADSYINALMHLRDKHDVASFEFVIVTGGPTEGPSAGFVEEQLVPRLTDLGKGIYAGKRGVIEKRTCPKYGDLAATLRRGSLNPTITELDGLPGLLKRKAREVRPHRLFIDITGLPKVLAAQVMLISLANSRPVHTFELRHTLDREHPENSLYFSLPSGGFEYRSLSDDRAVKSNFAKLVRIERFGWALAATLLIALACFLILLLATPNNPMVAGIGLAASLFSISAGIWQLITGQRTTS